MKEPASSDVKPHHRPRLWAYRFSRKWPFLIWVAAVVLSYFLYSASVELAAFVGTVDAREIAVSPIEDALLISVNVQVNQTVTNGQALATMDSSLIDAEIAVSKALGTESTDSITERIMQLFSRYQGDIDNAGSQRNTELLAQAQATGELHAVKAERVRLQKLKDAGMLTDSTILTRLVTQEANLSEAVRMYPDSIAAVEKRIQEAMVGLTSLKKWLQIEDTETINTELVSERVKARTVAPAQQAALLNIRKEQYTLRAPSDGIVSHLYFPMPGSIITRGMPVASVLVATNRVMGFLPELYAKEVTNGMNAVILPRVLDAHGPIKATIAMVGSTIETLPSRIGGSSTASVTRGRRVYLTILEENTLVPGETVDIQITSLEDPWLRPLLQMERGAQIWYSRLTKR